jgi:hypothetical protein
MLQIRAPAMLLLLTVRNENVRIWGDVQMRTDRTIFLQNRSNISTVERGDT